MNQNNDRINSGYNFLVGQLFINKYQTFGNKKFAF